jgi:hypothetical protein
MPSYGSADGGYSSPPPGDFSQPSANGYGSSLPGSQSAGGPPAPGGGAAPYGGMPQQGSGGGSKKKWWLIGCGGCFVLAVLVVLGIIGIVALTSSGDDSQPSASSTAQEQTSDAPSDDPTTEDPAAEESSADESSSEDETTKDDSADGEGTRKDPLPAGSTTTVASLDDGEIDVELGKGDFDADEAIKKANEYNEDAPDGQKYILVPVTMTYHGDGSAAAGVDVEVSYVSKDGKGYDITFAETEHDWIDANEVYDGASVTYDLPFLVPDDDKGDGTFKISGLADWESDPVYVSAK